MCESCFAVGRKMAICTRCNLAWYCSTACQKAHWTQHKLACKSIIDAKTNSLAELPGVAKLQLNPKKITNPRDLVPKLNVRFRAAAGAWRSSLEQESRHHITSRRSARITHHCGSVVNALRAAPLRGIDNA